MLWRDNFCKIFRSLYQVTEKTRFAPRGENLGNKNHIKRTSAKPSGWKHGQLRPFLLFATILILSKVNFSGNCVLHKIPTSFQTCYGKCVWNKNQQYCYNFLQQNLLNWLEIIAPECLFWSLMTQSSDKDDLKRNDDRSFFVVQTFSNGSSNSDFKITKGWNRTSVNIWTRRIFTEKNETQKNAKNANSCLF